MNTDPPRYVAPPPDPGLALLTQQSQDQTEAAIQERTSQASARLMQRYGTRIASAGSNWSPLIAPAPMAGAFGQGAAPMLINSGDGRL